MGFSSDKAFISWETKDMDAGEGNRCCHLNPCYSKRVPFWAARVQRALLFGNAKCQALRTPAEPESAF